MDPLRKRREEDLKKIRDLNSAYPGIVEILNVDSSISKIDLKLKVPTAADASYPRRVQESTVVSIELSARYPFETPRASVQGTVWNPNVFTNGIFCFGSKWIPTEGLDMFVERIIKILSFDPLIINTQSPANMEASSWYTGAKSSHPAAFPSMRLGEIKKTVEKPKIIWKSAGMKGSLKDL